MARDELDITKRDGRYVITVNTGPAAGTVLGGDRLKREAERIADELAGEPWARLYPTPKAAAASDGNLTATVPIALVRVERAELLRLRRDVAAHHRILIELNPQVVEHWGQGGAMVLDRYRAQVREEAANRLAAGDEHRADELGGVDR